MTALKRALVRLLWISVANDARCMCAGRNRCPLCDAMIALGYARWVDAHDAAICLRAEEISP